MAIKKNINGGASTIEKYKSGANSFGTVGGSGFSYTPYQVSQDVINSQLALENHNNFKPSDWTGGTYGDAVKNALAKIQNREKFSYDINGDALYQQYKDQYMRQGKLAMQDTMGQAAAMTGGYGNSYAASVGNQAYQGYLAKLNDVVPELYQMARDQYNQEGQDLYNQYGLVADAYGREYGEYQDKQNAWLAERDFLANKYNADRDFDYSKYADGRDFAFGTYQQGVAEQQWQDEMDFNRDQFDYQKTIDSRDYAYQLARDVVKDKQWQDEFNYAKDQDKKKYDYQVGRDTVADQQWQDSFSYTKDRDKVSDTQWQKEMDYKNKVAGFADGNNNNNGNGGNPSGNEPKPTGTLKATKGTTSFEANLTPISQFGKRSVTKGYSSYEDYVQATIDKWLDSGRINDNEAAYLIQNLDKLGRNGR